MSNWRTLKSTFTRYTTYLVGIATVITATDQVKDMFFEEKNDPAIYGRWESQYEYPDSVGMVNLHGITEFLDDDSYRYTGFVTLTAGQPPVDSVFRVNAAGTWKGDDDKIITKLTNMKSSLEEVRIGEIKLNGSMLVQTMREPPKLESKIPMGTSERYKVLALEDDLIKLQVDSLNGEPIVFTMLKTSERSLGKRLPAD